MTFDAQSSLKQNTLVIDSIMKDSSAIQPRSNNIVYPVALALPTVDPEWHNRESSELFVLSCSSWSEIEEELTAALKTSARFGPRKDIMRIGENCGFMSVCCLLQHDWMGCNKDERCRLPPKIVFKFSHSGVLEAVAQDLIGCKLDKDVIYDALRMSNNTEGLFYSLLTPSTADSLHVPRRFCSKEIDDDGDVGHVMLQYVEGSSLPCYEQLSIGEIEQIIELIARLQSFSSKNRLENREDFAWNPWKKIGQCVLTNTVARKVIYDIPVFYGAHFEPMTEKLLVVLDEIYNVNAPIREIQEIAPVLVHGDLWQSNLICSEGVNRPRQLRSILDWQSAHLGSPAEDFVFLVICVLSGEDRRKYWRSLLRVLYDAIEREMCPGKPSFSVDDLIESYKRLFPVLGLIVIMRFSVIFKCSLPTLSLEDQFNIKRKFTRKLFCLVEDVLSSFEKSQETGTNVTDCSLF